MKMKSVWMDEMNWTEVEQAIKDAGGIVLIPNGCLEQWAHLPVGCDNYQVMGHTTKVIELAQADSEIKQIVVLPLLPMGCQPYMADFPGTISVRHSVMCEYYKDIAESLIKQGVSKFIWMCGHSGNLPPLIDAGRELKEKYGVLNVLDRCWVTNWEHRGPRTPAEIARGGHTSGSLALPMLSDETLKRTLPQKKVWMTEGRSIHGWSGTDDFTSPRFDDSLGLLTAKLKTSLNSQGQPMTVYMVGAFQEATPYGGFGDPTNQNVEDGRHALEAAAKHTIAIIKAINKIKVPLKSSPSADVN
jgi:creatinine amidohydrolase/Fe(II)-dependent formamide hydrolase-like protein